MSPNYLQTNLLLLDAPMSFETCQDRPFLPILLLLLVLLLLLFHLFHIILDLSLRLIYFHVSEVRDTIIPLAVKKCISLMLLSPLNLCVLFYKNPS